MFMISVPPASLGDQPGLNTLLLVSCLIINE